MVRRSHISLVSFRQEIVILLVYDGDCTRKDQTNQGWTLGYCSDWSEVSSCNHRSGRCHSRQHVPRQTITWSGHGRSVERASFLERELAKMGGENGQALGRRPTDKANVGV